MYDLRLRIGKVKEKSRVPIVERVERIRYPTVDRLQHPREGPQSHEVLVIARRKKELVSDELQ